MVCCQARAVMQVAPCGHQSQCRLCFVHNIQEAVASRQLPLRCLLCNSKIMRVKNNSAGGGGSGKNSSEDQPQKFPKSVSGYSLGNGNSNNNNGNGIAHSASNYSMSSGKKGYSFFLSFFLSYFFLSFPFLAPFLSPSIISGLPGLIAVKRPFFFWRPFPSAGSHKDAIERLNPTIRPATIRPSQSSSSLSLPQSSIDAHWRSMRHHIHKKEPLDTHSIARYSAELHSRTIMEYF